MKYNKQFVRQGYSYLHNDLIMAAVHTVTKGSGTFIKDQGMPKTWQHTPYSVKSHLHPLSLSLSLSHPLTAVGSHPAEWTRSL